MKMEKPIELTDQIIKTIEQCVPDIYSEICLTCPLTDVCLEYFANKGNKNQDLT